MASRNNTYLNERANTLVHRTIRNDVKLRGSYDESRLEEAPFLPPCEM